MTTDATSTRRVLEAISRHLGVDASTIRGRDRTTAVVAARRVAIGVLREHLRMPYRRIGEVLGRAHHTIVFVHRGTGRWKATRDLVEHVVRMMDQESQRTRRAVEDIEEVFRRAREDAGVATRPRDRPR